MRVSNLPKQAQNFTNKVTRTIVRQKSPLLAVASGASYIASQIVPPPARSVCLAGSVLAGVLSASFLAKDLTEKITGTLDRNIQQISGAVSQTGGDVTNALGGNVLKPIKLKAISPEEKQKLSQTQPIMDEAQKTVFDRITQWIGKNDKPTYNETESNYTCVYMYGPPGTGKTVFAKALFGAVDNKYDFKLANITAGDLMERGAEKLNHLKNDVLSQIDKATADKPICLGFFLDEVEGSLNKDRMMNPGVVNEYLTFVNEIKDKAAHNKNVYIIGALATNYDTQVDRASRRDGRVTETLHVDYPSLEVKKQVLDMVIDKLDNNLFTNNIKNSIKALVNNASSESPITKALNEQYLVGASIENAIINTQKSIFLDKINQNNIPTKFIEYLEKNITTASKTATEQRKADEAELKERQSMSMQAARMANALEAIASKDSSGNLSEIAKSLKEIAEKTGDNKGIKEILDNMGKKFEAMQAQGDENTRKIIAEISKFIQHIDNATIRANNSAEAASKSAEAANKSENSASNSAWSASAYVSAFKSVANNMSILRNISENLDELINAYKSWSTRAFR